MDLCHFGKTALIYCTLSHCNGDREVKEIHDSTTDFHSELIGRAAVHECNKLRDKFEGPVSYSENVDMDEESVVGLKFRLTFLHKHLSQEKETTGRRGDLSL